MSRILMLLIPVFIHQSLFPQTSQIADAEASLQQLFEQVYLAESSGLKKQLNDSILREMNRILQHRESFEYPFDSLTRIGNLRSPDNTFRLYTWNVPVSGFEHEYYGIIQYNSGRGKACRIHVLQDQKESVSDPLHLTATVENWPGALYYQVLRNKTGRNVIYTLIGFHFNDRFSDKKIIDVMYFDENGKPRFGKPVFNTENGIQHRVIFEYSGEVVMNVRYNQDMKMIVYDHLSPIEPELLDHPRFYAPDFSYDGYRFIEPELLDHPRFYAPDFSYDGYRFKGGMWIHQSNIDVRNR
jgi:hypothetical protein